MRRTAKTSSSWASAIERGDKPAYLAIADAIAADIDTGALTANQRLPTLRVLARELDLNFTTVARAYAEARRRGLRSEEHTSELQSLMRLSYAVFCLKKKKKKKHIQDTTIRT